MSAPPPQQQLPSSGGAAVRMSGTAGALQILGDDVAAAVDETTPQKVDLQSYLAETKKVAYSIMQSSDNDTDGNNVESTSLKVTENHLKSMIRGLLKLDKHTFEKGLQDCKVRRQWNCFCNFCQQHLVLLLLIPSNNNGEDDAVVLQQYLQKSAPKFFEGLRQTDVKQESRFAAAPAKLASLMANGRTYQGKLEALLQDPNGMGRPDLLPTYEKIWETPSLSDLCRDYVEWNYEQQTDHSLSLVYQCLDTDWPPPAVVPADVVQEGRRSGIMTELDLQGYLSSRFPTAYSVSSDSTGGEEDDMTTPSLSSSILIATNVFVKSQKPKRAYKRRNSAQTMLEISLDCLPEGITNEFDALILERPNHPDGGEGGVELMEVWEAKASLHPITIHDALLKKQIAIGRIVEDPDAKVRIVGKKSSSKVDCEADENRSTFCLPLVNYRRENKKIPRLGLFGGNIFPPYGSAKRLLSLSCEERLEKDTVAAVQQALTTGYVTPCAQSVHARLDDLDELASSVDFTMVVAASPSDAPFSFGAHSSIEGDD